MIDKLDIELLKEVAKQNRRETSISALVKPFLEKKSHRALYERVLNLSRQGSVRLDKRRDRILVRITKKGRSEIRSFEKEGISP